MMNLTDLYGKMIEVTDLDLALLQADDYRHYRVTAPTENDLRRYAYWEDMYQKLVQLKNEQS